MESTEIIDKHIEKEGDYYVIKSEMLGIIGTGLTEDEAEKSFTEEFDYIYKRLNSQEDESLSKRNRSIKDILNQIVQS
jgi:predicted RNase H-like HicB family nuclease